jgi:hypothetical protein
VHRSDHPYGDIQGSEKPDISVGRIIGDTARSLIDPIRISIGVHKGETGYHFDRSHAILVHGTGKCNGDFARNVNRIADILDPPMSVTKIDWRDYPGRENETFKSNTSGKDIVYFSGHGSIGGWSPGLYTTRTGDFPVDFGGTNPFVFASSCLTGDYSGNDIATKFLDCDAAVYIGATQVSPISKNCAAGNWFFNHWDPSESIGDVLLALERAKYSTDKYYSKWWKFAIFQIAACRVFLFLNI